MKRYILASVIVFVAQFSYSQSLDKRWQDMLDASNSYQNYKVIKKTGLSDVWKSVQDSVSWYKASLKGEKLRVNKQLEQIMALQNQVKSVQAKLDSVSEEKDNMAFLGIQVDKHNYANTLWIIIGIVLLGSAVMFFLYKNSHVVARQKVNEYEDLFAAFEDYKKNNIEKERKLKRELQTQMNTIDELKRKTRV